MRESTHLALEVFVHNDPQWGLVGLVELLGHEAGDVGVPILQRGKRVPR